MVKVCRFVGLGFKLTRDFIMSHKSCGEADGLLRAKGAPLRAIMCTGGGATGFCGVGKVAVPYPQA